MKFYQYITESRFKTLNTDQVRHLLNTKYSEWWKSFKNKTNILNRGDNISTIYLEVDPSKGGLRKNTGTGYSTLLFDYILPSWRKMPSRQKGIFCATHTRIKIYGGFFFYVIPVNNTKVAVCSEHDLWDSFNDLSTLVNLNRGLYKLFNKLGMNVDDLNWRTLKNRLENIEVDEFLDEVGKNIYNLDKYRKYTSVIDLLDNLLNPAKNGFMFCTANKQIPINREVWFDTSCLFLNTDFINEI